ncbi:MAG TPA: pyrimidine 5'-nucleotidase [Rhodocyclaceae bacterium]
MRERTWLFDLDNTLHDASPHIFPHLHHAMREYIERFLGLDAAAAAALREGYWHRYGATLLGLMRHHGTDPRHFLHHTHQFDDLPGMVVFERPLRAMLAKLPGRKIVFSNAPLAYTEAVLAIAGIRGQFDSVWTIERLRFQPKPQLAGFRRLLHRERLDPRTCVMIEDSPANLRTAKSLGMKTVLVSRGPRVPAYVDLRLQSVLELPRHLSRL